MPDWTYAPVLEPALRRLPAGQGRRLVLRSAARLSRVPGGTRLIALLAWSRPLPELRTEVLGQALVSPIGISSGIDPEGRAGRALEALGCGFVEVGPEAAPPAVRGLVMTRFVPGLPVHDGIDVLLASPQDLAEALTHQRPVLTAVESAPEAAGALRAGSAGLVVPAALLPALAPGTTTYVPDAVDSPADAVRLVEQGATLVGVSTGLRAHGPGLPMRCNEALASTRHGPRPPWRITDSWVASLLIGIALLATGIGAAIISFGPVLLSYDEDFLHGGTEALDLGRLLDFVQHDRITFAGVGLSLGVLYTSLAWWGIRAGWRWAQATLVLSCLIGMASLFLFFGFGYFEPLHATVTASLIPLLLLVVLRPPARPTWHVRPEPADAVRRRALTGQLLLVVVGIGLMGGGLVISLIAINDVFVSTDVTFIGLTPADIAAASDRIVPFVAHDRAGFGGALLAEGVALLGLALWGFRPGERWVWWTLLLAAVASGGPTIAIHWAVGYTSFSHLAPVYLAAVLSVVGLGLSHEYLTRQVSG